MTSDADATVPVSRWDALRSHLLTAFSGTETGRPHWVEEIETGDDVGYFGEGSAAWAVHGGLATLVAGAITAGYHFIAEPLGWPPVPAALFGWVLALLIFIALQLRNGR